MDELESATTLAPTCRVTFALFSAGEKCEETLAKTLRTRDLDGRLEDHHEEECQRSARQPLLDSALGVNLENPPNPDDVRPGTGMSTICSTVGE